MKVSKGKPVKATKAKSSKLPKKTKTQYVVIEMTSSGIPQYVAGPYASAEAAHEQAIYGGTVKRLEMPIQL